MTRSTRWTLLFLAVALVYSVVRYHVFGGVAPEHFPLFILNKAISLAAVFLFAAALMVKQLPAGFGGSDPDGSGSGRAEAARRFGQSGFILAALHSLISLIILSPEYYPKFYLETGRLNLVGELSMLLGVLSFGCFSLAALGPLAGDKTKQQKLARTMGLWGFLLVGLHVLVMGWNGWLKPVDWHGALPPISLVAFLAILVAAASFGYHQRLRDRRNGQTPFSSGQTPDLSE
jgi:hypothetical protein